MHLSDNVHNYNSHVNFLIYSIFCTFRCHGSQCVLLEFQILYALSTACNYSDFVPLITGFGVNGDALDRAIAWPDQSDIRVHCDTAEVNSVVTWYKSDGAPIGTANQNLRQTSYLNGTTLLQIASNRLVSYCDAGVFYCIVRNSRGLTQNRTFTLLFTGVFIILQLHTV